MEGDFRLSEWLNCSKINFSGKWMPKERELRCWRGRVTGLMKRLRMRFSYLREP
jgi:hypothetical protein